jgi:hypothetical protein
MPQSCRSATTGYGRDCGFAIAKEGERPAARTCHSPSVHASDRCTSESAPHSGSGRSRALLQTPWPVSGGFLGPQTGTTYPYRSRASCKTRHRRCQLKSERHQCRERKQPGSEKVEPAYLEKLVRKQSVYSITLVACSNTLRGKTTPSARAVRRLTTKSYTLGCSTGMSAGFAPRRIRFTSSAVRRNKSGTFTPYDNNPPAWACPDCTIIGSRY